MNYAKILREFSSIQSSYSLHNYGKVFYTTVRAHRPTLAVELGVLNGYSALHIALSMKHNLYLYGYGGTIHCYDLWDKYPYKHGSKSEVQAIIDRYDLQDFMKLYEADAYEVYKDYDNNSVHLLHVDISNDGNTVERMMDLWHNKIVMNGMIMFEGGSEERDKIEWMVKYNKKPIAPVVRSHPVIRRCYLWGIYRKFPSLTVLVKKRE